MGKRELLLVGGFVLLGVLVYQLTAPASTDTTGAFAAWWARLRSHIQEHRVEQPYERKAEVPVPAEVKTVSVDLVRGTVTIVGEARETIAVDAKGVVLGADAKMVAEVEKQISLKVAPDGSVLRVGIVVPGGDELARRPRPSLNVTIRVPSRLAVEAHQTGGELTVTDVAAIHLPKTSGRVRFARITGSVTGELERGSLDVERVGSVALKLHRCDARLEAIAGAFELEAQRCEIRARGVGGASTLKIEEVEGELEESVGPVTLKGVGGEFRIRGARGPIDAESTRTTLILVPAEAVPITATVDRDQIEITLPRGGVEVDALAKQGDIRAPDGLLTFERDDDQVKATGTVRGGGPRIQLRTTRGDIVVR
jgi:hypothetical protein